MKLIKIKPDHFIIVDDSEIKEGDFVLETYINETNSLKQIDKLNDIHPFLHKKITHSTQPLEFEGVKVFDKKWNEGYFDKVKEIFLSEVKELIGEVDVKKKAEETYREFPHNPKEKPEWEYNKDINCHRKRKAFIKGYNQCLEDNKDKKYTEEYVKRIVEKSKETGLTAEYLMLSLQLKTEWNVKFIDGKLKLK